MRYGVADYGMSAWDGGLYDYEERLAELKSIGYEGIERLPAHSADEAVYKSARVRRLNMDYASIRGPSAELSIQWSAAFGRSYVWVESKPAGYDLDTFCRQANLFVRACRRWGLKAALHNHMGTCVETQEQLATFLQACPECSMVLDTAHLAAVGGDPAALIRSYPDRIQVMHMKDWHQTDPAAEPWHRRGRFCELGGGNIGMDHRAVMQALKKAGYDGWIFVEQDTHLRDPLEDLAVSLRLLKELEAEP